VSCSDPSCGSYSQGASQVCAGTKGQETEWVGTGNGYQDQRAAAQRLVAGHNHIWDSWGDWPCKARDSAHFWWAGESKDLSGFLPRKHVKLVGLCLMALSMQIMLYRAWKHIKIMPVNTSGVMSLCEWNFAVGSTAWTAVSPCIRCGAGVGGS